MALRAVRLAAFCFVLGTLAGPATARDLVVGATGEAALAQPMVVLTLDGRGAAPSAPQRRGNLEDLLDDLPSVAILDTGASGHVLSHGTAARFDVQPEPGSRYLESGMSGDHAMRVSRPLAFTVADFAPEGDDARGGRSVTRPTSVRLTAQRVLLNDAPSDPTALLMSPGALVDVIGMPLLRERTVEIAPGDDATAGVVVRMRPSSAGLAVDAWIPLTLVDFSLRDPRNRGPAPVLAPNPLVDGVRVRAGAASAEADWLLDTGAACSMISTDIAHRLGLVDAAGAPTRRPGFTLPVGGVGGGSSSLPGYRLDEIALTTDDGRRILFPHPAVVVHDIRTTDADGRTVTLDGVLGMNLLLPSGSGMTMLGAATQLPPPFERVVVDVPKERMGLAIAR